MPSAALERLLHATSGESSIDRKALARLLAELARNVDSSIPPANDIPRVDPRLEQLRTLLVGREIESLSRLSRQIDDPEQLAGAISRVLPAAITQASGRDGTLGEVLAPAVERATQSSIRSNPHTLVNILYPLILHAIRKSIGDAIDATFQSLNESLKYSLSWRGLKWRWEAWRTGVPFAAVVLKHTLVFQVEHAFLIHRHTGLLIAHVAAEEAVSQDPQIVSSMLVAIQDFVRDSFSGASQQGLDALRLGELTLWSESGPFAALVAVIRGNPPESLHDTLRDVLSRIHAARAGALEAFSGDSSGFADIEARLREVVQLRQQAPEASRSRYAWQTRLVVAAALGLLGWWAIHWWWSEHRWQGYVSRLRAQPGIMVTDVGKQDGKWRIGGLRDPVSVDPQQLLRESSIDPARVVGHWQYYVGLNPDLVLRRMTKSLQPPPGITLSIVHDQIVAHGAASPGWLQRARAYVKALPEGAPPVDFSQVQDHSSGALGELRDAIQSNAIRFGFNESLPAASEDALVQPSAGAARRASPRGRLLDRAFRFLTDAANCPGRRAPATKVVAFTYLSFACPTIVTLFPHDGRVL